MIKFTTVVILMSSAIFAEGIEGLKTGQPEISGAASIIHFPGNVTKAGISVDGGVLVHPNFAIVGEYNYTPIGSRSATFYGVRTTASARFHSLQAGGRVNILSRGRVIPYIAGTAGLIRVGASASVNSSYVSYSDGASVNRFGFGVGGGSIVRATQHVDIKVDLRGLKGKEVSWIARATVGVGFRF